MPKHPQKERVLPHTGRRTGAVLPGYGYRYKCSHLQKTWLRHIQYMQSNVPATSITSTSGFLSMNEPGTCQMTICFLTDEKIPPPVTRLTSASSPEAKKYQSKIG